MVRVSRLLILTLCCVVSWAADDISTDDDDVPAGEKQKVGEANGYGYGYGTGTSGTYSGNYGNDYYASAYPYILDNELDRYGPDLVRYGYGLNRNVGYGFGYGQQPYRGYYPNSNFGIFEDPLFAGYPGGAVTDILGTGLLRGRDIYADRGYDRFNRNYYRQGGYFSNRRNYPYDNYGYATARGYGTTSRNGYYN